MRDIRTSVRIGAMAVLLTAVPAHADYPVYRVINVDMVDTLNVRASANPVSAILTELDHDAQMLEILEEENGWGRIIVDGLEGWVAMAYLAPMPRPTAGEAAAPGGFICAGTEPFWGLSLGTSGAVEFYDGLTLGEALASRISDGRTASGRFYPYAYQIEGEASGLAIIDRAECSDGMSDLTYGWRAYLNIHDRENGTRLLEGCCRTPVQQ